MKKTIRFIIDLPMDFPDNWNDDLIDFHINESSWCCSNIIDLLEDYDNKHGCLCNICSGKILNKNEVIE